MRRQVITGGAIVVISVASAAAYSIVQTRWFGAATPRSVARVETADATSALAPKSESVAQAPRGVPQASAVQGVPPRALIAPPPLGAPPAPLPQAPPPPAARPPPPLPQS